MNDRLQAERLRKGYRSDGRMGAIFPVAVACDE
jgi:hypothetical protein